MKNTKSILIVLILLISIFVSSTVYATDFVPPNRVLSRVEDEGDLLTDEEEQKLREKLDEISERQNVDVVIVTNYSLGGKTPMEFADDYFDYNGYGLGPDYDGVLLLVSMEERDWWISTHGFGITAFTDYGIQKIGDEIVGDLGNGDYYYAFNRFGTMADDFITQAKTGEPYDVKGDSLSEYVKPKKEHSLGSFLGIGGIALALGGIAGKGYTSYLTNTHKTKRKAYYASGYQLGVANFTSNFDRFINRNVTRTRKPEPKSSGGGSSTHTSSSGRSHGGGGGKF